MKLDWGRDPRDSEGRGETTAEALGRGWGPGPHPRDGDTARRTHAIWSSELPLGDLAQHGGCPQTDQGRLGGAGAPWRAGDNEALLQAP